MRVPIAREGYVFFVPPLVAGGALLALGWPALGWPVLALGLFLVSFFRDPDREIGGDERSVVAPADGRIVALRRREGGTEMSIFLSPLDVHVNRSPMDGRLEHVEYHTGRFRPAFLGAASHENEHIVLRIRGDGLSIVMKEITGVLVRRIVLHKKRGDELRRGERIGLMKFGSRVDLELPESIEVSVREGQFVRGGVTVLGEVRS